MEEEKNKELVRDPVCGMWIIPEDAADEAIFKGKIFYFCAPGCKSAFEKNPKKYFIKQKRKNMIKEENI